MSDQVDETGPTAQEESSSGSTPAQAVDDEAKTSETVGQVAAEAAARPAPKPKEATSARKDRPSRVASAGSPARKQARSADRAGAKDPPETEVVSRREFLNYIWGATMALLLAEMTGMSVLFALPRFREGEFGGFFNLGLADEVLPAIEDPPRPNDVGKYWLVQTDEGALAIYKVCTHLGCLYKWVETTNRFECPCHGSKFEKNGDWIEGPAPRALDRFVIEALDTSGNVTATTGEDGDPLRLPGEGLQLRIDTGKRILGKLHA
jgi:cytochrome b6-f complex iron-sulfur subunit